MCGKEFDFESNSIGEVVPKYYVQFGKIYESKKDVEIICKACTEKYGKSKDHLTYKDIDKFLKFSDKYKEFIKME